MTALESTTRSAQAMPSREMFSLRESASRRVRRYGDGPGGRWLLRAMVVLVVATFAVGAWRRRWMADDGLIVLRTVRNLYAGNGPVFNSGERVEANTSTLWTYVVAAFGWVPGISLEWVSVWLCLLLSCAGLALAMLASARLQCTKLALPLGALVYIVLPPARDFATSGLETGLVLAWLGAMWWQMARRAMTPRNARWRMALALTAGLGPLVRPELAVVAILALVLVLAEPSGLRQKLLLVTVAAALPVAYQVFRMGYYGLPVPGTAIAKEASGAEWAQGRAYLANTADTYTLWLPLVLLTLVFALAYGQRRPKRDGRHWSQSSLAVVGVMVLSGLVLIVYCVRVGGDFMHGRMLLPGIFCLLSPLMVMRVPTAGARQIAILVGGLLYVGVLSWAGVTLLGPGLPRPATVNAHGIVDERAYYIQHTGVLHPVEARDFSNFPSLPELTTALRKDPRPGVWFPANENSTWVRQPVAGDRAVRTVYFVNLGFTSMNLGLDVRVEDMIGLADPLAAHTRPIPGIRIGHNKYLPIDWVGAQAHALKSGPYLNPVLLAAADRALQCPETEDLVDSYRAPLTADRFWNNLTGAVARSSYRISRDPVVAAAQCSARQ